MQIHTSRAFFITTNKINLLEIGCEFFIKIENVQKTVYVFISQYMKIHII